MYTFSNSRVLAATPEDVFAAMADPQRLARWWGPAGFSNEFEVCEFHEGGRWVFTMVGPDGTRYPNESVFVRIEPGHLLVVDTRCSLFFDSRSRCHRCRAAPGCNGIRCLKMPNWPKRWPPSSNPPTSRTWTG